ncbi:MAG: enoyl-CoA hydratase/isomerase family protein [Deltaproteobacteria bacterium]|nr:enoyl-CoA hydratase/isomerase family protein [Deltaproteobacteria bacterium]
MSEQSYRLIQQGLVEDECVLDVQLAGGKGNILNMAMMDELRSLLDAHEGRKRLRLVLVRGADKYFSYGASVEEHVAERVPVMLPAFHGLIRAVAKYPVPIAALVRGRCLGGAFELVLACHLVFATPDALFACPEIKLGVFPPVLAAIGAQRLGGATAERLLLTGAELGAEEALRIGWLTALLGAEAEPREDVLAWYRANLKPLSAFSLRQATAAARECGPLARALGEPLDRAESLYLKELGPSHDGNEGIAAFIEQRKPKWTHS